MKHCYKGIRMVHYESIYTSGVLPFPVSFLRFLLSHFFYFLIEYRGAVCCNNGAPIKKVYGRTTLRKAFVAGKAFFNDR